MRDIDWGRLCEAKKESRRTLERYRVARKTAVRMAAGDRWVGSGEKVFVNLLSIFVKIISRHLVPKMPRVMLSTFNRSARPTVEAMERWTNDHCQDIDLAETFRRIITDALYSIGVAKVCIASPQDSALTGWGMQAGTVACWRVDLDDFVFDTFATDFREASFIGHRYRMIYDLAMEKPEFSKKQRKKLTPSGIRSQYNESGDERIAELQIGNEGRNVEFEDYVDLWELYLPRDRVVVTIADDSYEPLMVQQWLGPDTGPYHILNLDIVPGSAMGKGPVQDLVNLHELSNRLYSKLARQAERQKDLLMVQSSAVQDGERVVKSSDGDTIRVDNPDRIAPISLGGPNQLNLAMYAHGQSTFDYAAGNLSLLGGLGNQSPTAAQDKMLNQNAGATVADQQERTITFFSKVMRSMCWFWWHDPMSTMKTVYELPGSPEFSVPREVTPENRKEVSWQDARIRVDPYSLQNQSPDNRLSFLSTVVKEMMPLMPLLMQNGIQFDINYYLEKISKYSDTPDIVEMFKILEPPENVGMSGSAVAIPMQGDSEKRYVRESVPQRTQSGDARNMMNNAMGYKTGGDPRQ